MSYSEPLMCDSGVMKKVKTIIKIMNCIYKFEKNFEPKKKKKKRANAYIVFSPEQSTIRKFYILIMEKQKELKTIKKQSVPVNGLSVKNFLCIPFINV